MIFLGYDGDMKFHYTLLSVSALLCLPALALAQSAPGGPLFPSAGWAAQQAGVGPVGSKPAILGKSTFALSILSNSAIAGKTESVLRYGVTDKLSVGLMYFERQDKLRGNVSYTITPETVESPSINVGFYDASVGGKSSAVYATAGRTISDMGPVTFSGYLGVAKVNSESAPRLLVGAAVPIFQNRLTASAQWEGKKLSLGIVGSVGTLGKYPVRLGVLAVGDTLGTLGSTTWQR